MAHVAEAKKQELKTLIDLMSQYPIVCILNLENLPAKQLQIMRERLRSTVVIRMSKTRIIKLALEQTQKENIQDLKKYLKGMPALLFTKESPFKLFKILKKNKSRTFIKAGQTAPSDITVHAGPTGFAPGPIIGELGALKIKAGIEGGKVVIKADSIVAHQGDVIDAKAASVLQRLGIEPVEIGLDLVAAYEKGEILTKDILDVDESAFIKNIMTAHSDAMKLAMDIAYPTTETMTLLLQKAFRDAKNIALEQGIVSKDVINELLAKAEAQASALHSKTTI
ncbi:50S ribosomal protein L10 [Candidatus Woesearchaeota archaeon]|nr:MAG: 50S ribosomal protein L10 [Candidatus Woesearchaeota archaeon]